MSYTADEFHQELKTAIHLTDTSSDDIYHSICQTIVNDLSTPEETLPQHALSHATNLQRIHDLTQQVEEREYPQTLPFIQNAIDAECSRVGLESFTYSEEALKDKLAAAWRGVKRAFEVNKNVASSVYSWMRSDGKGLIQNGIAQVKIIRDRRREARDIQIDSGLTIAIEQGADLRNKFQTLVDEGYSDYADHRNDASKILRRVRPGSNVINVVGSSYSITEGNQALSALDEQTKALRDELNAVKRRSRDATGSGKSLANLIRSLDELSNLLEDVVNFIETLEKDERNWDDDKERLERLFSNDNTDIKGAEAFIKMASDNSVGGLLRFMTTMIRFISGTISRAHREMGRQQ